MPRLKTLIAIASILTFVSVRAELIVDLDAEHQRETDVPRRLVPSLSTRDEIGVNTSQQTSKMGLSAKEAHSNEAKLFQATATTNQYFLIGKNARQIAPSSLQCSIQNGDECCNDHHCSTKQNNVCVNRNCVDKGYPRFTLEWYGYDDYDLVVTTPSGAVISFVFEFDPTTGGRIGEVVNQQELGFHTENTYFPVPGAPAGTYTYLVQEFATKGRGSDWTLSVHDERGEIARHTGVGGSEIFSYQRLAQSIPSLPSVPTPPTPSPQSGPCSPATGECCTDSDCSGVGSVCVNHNCIVNGDLRFTLSWKGNDDLDLFVTTPGGETLSFVNLYDAVTGGRVGEKTDQLGSGFHVENTYFPYSPSTFGIFTFSVRPISTEYGTDKWTMEVFDDQRVVFSQSGFGASSDFVYNKSASPVAPGDRPTNRPTIRPVLPNPGPVQPPTYTCSILTDDCCSDSDCPTELDVCVQTYCIRDGNPRFTLIWDGDDDLDLQVTTPLGTTISQSLIFEPLSGGIFGADSNQGTIGSHFESIHFPIAGAPFGEYTLQVRSFRLNGSNDRWTLKVYGNGELLDTRSGTGDSDLIPYVRDGSNEPERPPTEGSRCNLSTDECCLKSDCGGGQVCVQRVCLERGFPRVTLTWTGDDNLDLILTTPSGKILSAGVDYDASSGARRQTNTDQADYDLNVDSIYFPYLDETIKYYVDSAAKRGPNRDFWTLTVYEGDTQVLEFSGFGDSKNFFFVPSPAIPTPFPTPSPNPFRPTTPTTVRAPTDVGQCPHDCCSSDDCTLSYEICVQRRCLAEGDLRFTLTWTGNDNIDLIVITPDGTELSNSNPADNQSGGFFEADSADGGFGFHSENTGFRGSKVPAGRYSYSVNAVTTRGTQDYWELRVFAYAQLVSLQNGQGASGIFMYAFSGDGTFPPTATPKAFSSNLPSVSHSPTATSSPTRLTPSPSKNSTGEVHVPCNETVDECCNDASCGSGEVCVQRQCITEGNPRFTLQWTGNDDLDLAIVTPLGSVVGAFQNDPQSGGVFGPGGDQFGFGFHVESIRFDGSTSGLYEYYINTFVQIGDSDTWRLSVFVKNQEVQTFEGTGSFSGNFEYVA